MKILKVNKQLVAAMAGEYATTETEDILSNSLALANLKGNPGWGESLYGARAQQRNRPDVTIGSYPAFLV